MTKISNPAPAPVAPPKRAPSAPPQPQMPPRPAQPNRPPQRHPNPFRRIVPNPDHQPAPEKACAKDVIEAMDFGQHPNWVDPQKQHKIERDKHPFSDNPAFPKELEPGSYPENHAHLKHPSQKLKSYADLTASDQYSTVAGAVRNYHGANMRHPGQVMMQGMGAMQRAMQLEQGHERELEQEAVRLVLDLPEFEQAKEAHAAGELKIMAKLTRRVNIQAPLNTDEPPEDEPDEVASEMTAEVAKRRFINMLMQGAAISKNYAFHLASDVVQSISPDMMRLYGAAMSAADLGYWAMPEDAMRAQMGAGEGAAGKARLEFKDGEVIIHAEAIIFPVLIQEIVKGIMEFLAYDPDEDPSVRQQTMAQADSLGGEIWDIKFGPAVWRQILRMIGRDNQRWTPQIFKYLSSLSPGQFSEASKEILKGTEKGRKLIDKLLAEIKQDNAASESAIEAAAENVADGLLNS